MTENVNVREGVNYYEKFRIYLCELLESYTKLAELLSKKLVAIANFNIDALDGIIKEEQVFVLLARGFDASLQSYREKLGLRGENLSTVIREMPEEYRPDFQAVFLKLKSKLDEVRSLNGKCQSLIEERIYRLERSISRIDNSSATPYGKPGAAAKPASGGEGHMLHKSV